MAITTPTPKIRSAFERVPIQLLPPTSERGRLQDITVYLIGCGGTGGWLAPHLARRVWRLQEKWHLLAAEHPEDSWRYNRSFKLIFVDPDVVEMKNILARQNFVPCDEGLDKAKVLALRYKLPWPIQIEARVKRFDPEWITSGKTTILVDCTDNADARVSINAALERNIGCEWPEVHWLSAGNGKSSGQVIFGNTTTLDRLAGALSGATCGRVPSPGLQEPGLLVPQLEELEAPVNLSCEDMVLGDEQSPTVNPHMAVWLDFYLHELLFGAPTLIRTDINVKGGSVSSIPTSASAWAKKFKVETDFFLKQPIEPLSQPGEEDEELNDEGDEDDLEGGGEE
jgi:molybdopterin/thiamine biosynthesis adenylyltransferase